MNCKNQFNAWVEEATRHGVPENVRAFSFNLVELPGDTTPFGVALVGTATFDGEDDDWACDDVWTADPGTLALPVALSTLSWESCLAGVKLLVLAALRELPAGRVLTSRDAVAIGFVDGDLEVLWRR